MITPDPRGGGVTQKVDINPMHSRISVSKLDFGPPKSEKCTRTVARMQRSGIREWPP